MALTPKQERFVNEYLIDLNATQAAIRAGYSKDTAYSTGHENLKKPEIQEAIQLAQKKRADRTGITQDAILNEIRGMAFCRLKDIAEWNEGGLRYFNSDEIKDDAGVSEVVDSRIIKSGGNGKEGGEDQILHSEIKLKRVSDQAKLKALELLGKHVGLFTEKKEETSRADIKVPELTYTQWYNMSEDDKTVYLKTGELPQQKTADEQT
jgi:phage terminase small subunit